LIDPVEKSIDQSEFGLSPMQGCCGNAAFLSLLLSWAFGDKFNEIQQNLSLSYRKDMEPFA
jgi:hypothetical protein